VADLDTARLREPADEFGYDHPNNTVHPISHATMHRTAPSTAW
jgi:hypothetical protein